MKKGDQVIVLLGKDRGKKGKIEKVFPKKGQVLVTGINIYKKHVKKQSEDRPGKIIEITKPLIVSKVALLCSKCKQRTRIGYLIDKKGEKSRICRKCREII